MTLAIAWVRKIGNNEELVIATDSRLTSGKAWDTCPKIKMLERGDSALCFAGDTDYAYPMMEQINNSINAYPKFHSRAADITDVRGHMTRIISNMREFLHNSIENYKVFKPEPPKTNFIYAGYSWKFKRFYIWKLMFNPQTNSYIYGDSPTLMGSHITVLLDAANYFKDDSNKLTSNRIRKRIYDRLVKKGKKYGEGLDMEPFEILRDIIRNEEDWAIGGSPQIVKIYRHLNTMPMGVYWPSKAKEQITLLGRPLLDYEILQVPILDPDSLALDFMKIKNEKFKISHDDGSFEKYRPL